MLSRHPRLKDVLRSSKRRARAPLLRQLRRSSWYRSISHLPGDEIVSCREYVRAGVGQGDTFIELDPATVSHLPSLAGYEQTETFVASLAGCRLYGRGVAVVGADDRLIAEGSVHIGGSPVDHAIRGRAWLPRPTPLPGTTAVVAAPAGNTYYHWLFDVLPRIALLRRAGIDLASVDRIAVSSVARPFQKETLTTLGIDLGKILETDVRRHVRCERMILPSYPGTSGFPPWSTCRFLRESLRSAPAPGPERIYVSRQRAGTRRIENGDEVEQLLGSAGFVTVYPEDYSVAEQSQLFHAARFVVAPHGSGLSNLVFAEPGASVLEIFPPDQVGQTHYRVLAGLVGIRHTALVGEEGRGTRAKGDFIVPLARLADLLDKLSG